jgi:hypothetical protein
VYPDLGWFDIGKADALSQSLETREKSLPFCELFGMLDSATELRGKTEGQSEFEK